ncbi:MAG: rod shape-determining protein RodA [Coxiella sp. (in: Bacteria)]|nr:MAG: rod shape-determining protein RodA [Coxiella sp. (in: g-proteobacteria)]
MPKLILHDTVESRLKRRIKYLRWCVVHLDPLLLIGLILLCALGLFILYSATNQNSAMVEKQGMRMGLGFVLMFVLAQVPPRTYKSWAPWLFGIGILLLAAVLVIGRVDQGARRWLVLGPIRVQPSEFMKIIVPMAMAWFFSKYEIPPRLKTLLLGSFMLAIPFILTAKQPDLGTAILIGSAGASVILLAGISWRYIFGVAVIGLASVPLLWHFMHAYQKNRVLIFLDPERAPLGSGYHIIQSKIAVGSGGLFGKGWLHGTQSHLSFLPAHATDFIFALSAEELGFIGCAIILLIYLAIFTRSLYLSTQAQETFTRLLAGGLSFMFIISALINIGMVIGILPVVGVPLPLISYGGSSIVTIMASFGIIMSIHTHKKLWNS